MNNYVNGYNLSILIIWGIENPCELTENFWKWIYKKSVISLFLSDDVGA